MIYNTVIRYLAYHYTEEVRVSSPMLSNAPVVTFCGPKANFISDRYYEQMFGRPVERPIGAEEYGIIGSDLRNMSVEQQFQVLYSIHDLKQLIGWKDIDIEISLNYNLYCFNIANSHVHIMHCTPLLLQLKVPEIMVFLHRFGDRLFDIEKQRYELISLKLNRMTNVNYETTELYKLPSPYASNCHSYSNGQTYDQLSIEYQKRLSIRNFGCLPLNYLTLAYDQSNSCQYKIEQDVLGDYTRFLSKALKPDCIQVYYKTSLRTALNIEENDIPGHIIKFNPSTFNQQIILRPEMTFCQLLGRVAAIVGLWLPAFAIYLMASVRIDNKLDQFKYPPMQISAPLQKVPYV